MHPRFEPKFYMALVIVLQFTQFKGSLWSTLFMYGKGVNKSVQFRRCPNISFYICYNVPDFYCKGMLKEVQCYFLRVQVMCIASLLTGLGVLQPKVASICF